MMIKYGLFPKTNFGETKDDCWYRIHGSIINRINNDDYWISFSLIQNFFLFFFQIIRKFKFNALYECVNAPMEMISGCNLAYS